MKIVNKFIILTVYMSIMTSCLTFGGFLESRYIKIAHQTLPAVVEVISIGLEGENSINNWQDFFQDQEDFQSDQMNTGVGSGVIVECKDNNYYILTNKHVVGDLDKVSILFHDNKLLTGEVIGSDDRFDIAVVVVETEYNYPTAKLSKGGNTKVGQFVAALGSPMSYVQSISMGIISNYGRFGGPKDNLSNYIQTDAAINHGNSGGPLVNMKGEVIGINTWISSPTSGNIGLGFAMPIENVYPSYRSIVDEGIIKIGWLGVSSYGIPDSEFYIDKKGAFVNQVVIESPAYKSGIRPGDIITSINSHKINSSEELFLYISLLQPEDLAELSIIRHSDIMDFSISLGKTTDNVLETSKKVFPGFILAKRDDNIVILQVLPKSIGLTSSFYKEDVILSINETELKNIEDFYQLLQYGQNNIVVIREEEELVLELFY